MLRSVRICFIAALLAPIPAIAQQTLGDSHGTHDYPITRGDNAQIGLPFDTVTSQFKGPEPCIEGFTSFNSEADRGPFDKRLMQVSNTLGLMRTLNIDVSASGKVFGGEVTGKMGFAHSSKLNQTSPFGAFLDPVADKLIVAVALVMLVQVHATAWLAVPAMVIVSREITVSALREWMAELGKRSRVAVSQLGKIKTVTQMTAITLLLAQKPGFDLAGDIVMTPWLWLSYGLLYLATALTLWSMLAYLRAAAPELLKSQSKS